MWSKLLTRENVDITTISGIDIVFFDSIWKFNKTKDEIFFTHFHKKVFTHYVNIDSYKWGMWVYKKYFNSLEKIKKHYQQGNQLKNKINKETKKWQDIINRENSQQNLLVAYKEFEKQLNLLNPIYSILSWLAIESWQVYFSQLLNKMIERENLQEKRSEIISSIYKPWKSTAINEIQTKLNQAESIDDLINKYQFLRSWSLIWHRPLTKRWINDLSKSTKRKIEYKKYSIGEIYKILKPNNNDKKLLSAAPYIVFFKDWRDDLRRLFCYKWLFLFQEIGSYFKINFNDLGYLTLGEIRECLDKDKIDKKNIINRKNNHCIITNHSKQLKIKIINSRNIPDKYKKAIKQSEERNNKVIKGLTGNKGKILGKVKIVNTYHDIKRFNNGEVLVANTTHPNYLPMMQKAVAFVTNEGGIISHAAIVARELGVPCVVGTKMATKVLKDGDLVEVDANQGIVKILAKSN